MTKALKDVEVGDKVWIDDGYTERARIETVVKLTPTQIVTDARYCPRYERGKPSRYGSGLTYYRIGFHGPRSNHISGIATKAEVKEWEARQEAARQRKEAEDAERARREALRQELNNLFGEHIHVEDHRGNLAGEWCVHMYLSEEGVRKLAALLSINKL